MPSKQAFKLAMRHNLSELMYTILIVWDSDIYVKLTSKMVFAYPDMGMIDQDQSKWCKRIFNWYI